MKLMLHNMGVAGMLLAFADMVHAGSVPIVRLHSAVWTRTTLSLNFTLIPGGAGLRGIACEVAISNEDTSASLSLLAMRFQSSEVVNMLPSEAGRM